MTDMREALERIIELCDEDNGAHFLTRNDTTRALAKQAIAQSPSSPWRTIDNAPINGAGGKKSDGSTEGRALQREVTQKPFPPDQSESSGLCVAGIKPGPSDDFKRGLDFAANWHEAEASHAKSVYSEMDRYSEDQEERSDWRSWKDKEDRHLYYAAVIRRLSDPRECAAPSSATTKDGGEA